MSHFAELDQDNTVTRVIVAEGEGEAGEQAVAEFLAAAEGTPVGRWKQTSYTGSMRGCYAGIGYTYDETIDEFVPPADVGVAEPPGEEDQ